MSKPWQAQSADIDAAFKRIKKASPLVGMGSQLTQQVESIFLQLAEWANQRVEHKPLKQHDFAVIRDAIQLLHVVFLTTPRSLG